MSNRAAFYLEPSLLKSARAGEHNFIARVAGVLDQAGWLVDFHPEDALGTDRDARALVHMAPPPPGGLTFRRVYQYPFWQIETAAERWHWHTAKSAFSPETVPEPEANRFFSFWRKRMFPEAATQTGNGFVYVPLQGRLTKRRSFQTCSPIEMIEHVLDRAPGKRIVAALHPKEDYSKADLQALEKLEARFPLLTLTTGGMEHLLPDCDYVVTMNSAAGFFGYFFEKPCILFGDIDFHHIALGATPGDLSAFDKIESHAPDYARYVWWFWQHMSINAGRPEAEDKIRDALIRGGWPLE
jgi:hypothetical protein